MLERDIRWPVLVPTVLLIALARLIAETGGLWFDFPARPDWLWAVAFCVVLRTSSTRALAVFFLCGLVRDIILGPRLGAATLAYLVVGWPVLHWRFLALTRGVPVQALLVAWSAFFVALVKHSLDYGPLAYKLVYSVFFISFGDGVLTGLAYLPIAFLLWLEPFRPWRGRR